MNHTAARLIRWTGQHKPDNITEAAFRAGVAAFANRQEEKDTRIKAAKIKGVQPHKSHKDPTETQKIISLQFFDENDNRIASGHARADGTGTIRYKRGSEP